MSEITYTSLFKKSFALFFKVLREYYLLIVSVAVIQIVYTLAFRIFFGIVEQSSLYLFIYTSLLKPVFLIIIIALIEQSIRKQKTYDVRLVYNGLVRCYVRYVLYYALISVFLFLLGHNGSILLYMFIFLKLPFVEASIYFENRSFSSAVKSNLDKTQGKLLRYLMLLLFVFLIVRIISFKFVGNLWLAIGLGSFGAELNELVANIFVLLCYSYFICLYWVIPLEDCRTGAD